MKSVFVLSAVLSASSLSALAVLAEDKEAAPKLTCKEVMKAGFKDGLCKKVADGQASKEETRRLLELVTALAANQPPRGPADSWKTKTDALIAAAKGCVDGKEGSAAELTAAMNCAACHKEHKPPMKQ